MVGARVRRQQVAYAAGARPVEPPRVRLALGRALDARLRVAAGGAGCAGRCRRCATLAGQYPRYGYRTIRIFLARQGHAMSADRTYRLWRQARAAGAEDAAAPPRGDEPAAAAAADRRQSRLGVRLRVRHVRRRPHAEVPDGHRRVHAGMPGHRRRRRHSIRPRHRGADAARERPRRAALSALGQRPRVRRDGDPALAADGADRDGVHRSGQALAEWHRRIVQRQVPRRVPDAAVVSESASTRRSASSSGGGTTTRCARTRASAI